MKQVYRFHNGTGKFIEPVLIEEGQSIPKNCTDIPLPQPNEKPVFDKNSRKWIETITDAELVAKYSTKKIEELGTQCEQIILSRFSVELPFGTYEFSNDEQAQSRFSGVVTLFNADLISEIEWTAYLNNERQRITLDKEMFNKVALASLKHSNDNITKYNDLLVRVTNATNLYELNLIGW